MTTFNVLSLVVPALVGLIALGSLLYKRRDTRIAAAAKDEAKRSADASERSAAAAETSSQTAANADRRAQAAEMANRVVWNFPKISKSSYQLDNYEGTQSAYGVRIDVSGLPRVDGPLELDEFSTTDVYKYTIIGGWGASADGIHISWHYEPDLSDEPVSKTLLL